LTQIQNDAQLLDEQRAATESADSARTLIQETYRGGGVTILQVLDAERSYAEARLGYTRTTGQRLVDSAQLFNAMGGGWWDWRAKDIEMSAKAKDGEASAKSAAATVKPQKD
jgi:outer membrane protein TolC